MSPLSNEAKVASARYLPAFDGIRAFAVFAVLAYHLRLIQFPGGVFGVDLFFTMSGFLITGLLYREFSREGTISILSFYLRRARRLIPALVVMLLVYSAVVWCMGVNWHRMSKGVLVALSGFSNWFDPKHGYASKDLAHLWSLSIEVQFCLIWAPFCWLLFRFVRNQASWVWICLFLVFLSFFQHHLLIAENASGRRLYNGTDVRFDAFALGAAARFLLFGSTRGVNFVRELISKHSSLIVLAGWTLHMVLACTTTLKEFTNSFIHFGGVALSCVVIVIGLSTDKPSIAVRLFSWSPLRFIGQISYGMYLWHYPILHVIPRGLLSTPVRAVVVIAASIILGIISYYLIELPCFKRRVKENNFSASAVSVGNGSN